ncbi:EsaB/YukD family protein [Heyndrickxia camelliae]|uniref:Ubiquitin-like domain-containing protein n=1 Tax=Heyndrickxia camelliae TaxID=1707093 RepID=A0A2N3LDJ4_9BACI|nr:EsaB/YukD family protein [Heyndrickxia camelliae]PKR82669.1 hypothetical protein CWO92_23095 [Heyndrickxia camelliae]
MPSETHINVTIDFSKWSYDCYDLRIPVHQPIKQLLANLVETLNLDISEAQLFAIKVPSKELLLTDDDRIADYAVANGDILIVL